MAKIRHANLLGFALTKNKPSGVCQEEQPHVHRHPTSGKQSNSCQTVLSFAASVNMADQLVQLYGLSPGLVEGLTLKTSISLSY